MNCWDVVGQLSLELFSPEGALDIIPEILSAMPGVRNQKYRQSRLLPNQIAYQTNIGAISYYYSTGYRRCNQSQASPTYHDPHGVALILQDETYQPRLVSTNQAFVITRNLL